MRRAIRGVLLLGALVLCAAAPVFASDEGTLLDNTVGLKNGVHGIVRADGKDTFTFKGKEVDVAVPYTQVTRLQYGYQSHVSAGYSLSTGLIPHSAKDGVMTLDYTDANQKTQTLVILLGKDKIFTTLINLKNKSHVEITFTDEKAHKEALAQAAPGQIK